MKTTFHAQRISSYESAKPKFALESVFAFIFNKYIIKTRHHKNVQGYDVAVTRPES